MSWSIILLQQLNLTIVFNRFSCEHIVFYKTDYQLYDIYTGYIPVQAIYPNLNAAFATLNPDKQGFIPLNLLTKNIAKVPETSSSMFLMQIFKEPIDNKLLTVTTEIVLKTFNLISHISVPQPFSHSSFPYFNVKFSYICLIKLLAPINLGIEFNLSILNIFYLDLIGQLEIIYASFLQLSYNISRIEGSPKLVFRQNNFLLASLDKVESYLINNFFVSSYKQALAFKDFLILEYLPLKYIKTQILFYRHNYNIMLLHYFDILLYQLLQPSVYTSHGIYIEINKTEALFSIDVNSGAYFSSHGRNTNLQINIIATKCIIKQIKLRNLAGVIVIDFIDIVQQFHQLQLLAFFKYLLVSESLDINLVQLSEICLLELTRKRKTRSLYDFFNMSNYKNSFLYHQILYLDRNIVKNNLLVHYTLFSNVKLIYN